MGWIYKNDVAGITDIGGIAVKMIACASGGTIPKGAVVNANCSSGHVIITPADEMDPIGIAYSTAAAGSDVWVVVAGVAQAKLENSMAATTSNWARISVTADGRIAVSALPTGASFAGVDSHFHEVGHVLETVSAAPTGALVKIAVHFN